MFAAGLFVVLLGGVLSDKLVRKKGLLFGRRFFGMTILGGTAIALFITGFTSSLFWLLVDSTTHMVVK